MIPKSLMIIFSASQDLQSCVYNLSEFAIPFEESTHYFRGSYKNSDFEFLSCARYVTLRLA